jgi:hypothetical protein
MLVISFIYGIMSIVFSATGIVILVKKYIRKDDKQNMAYNAI